MTLYLENLNLVDRQIDWLRVQFISYGMLVKTQSLPDVLIFTEGLVVLATEVVLVPLEEPIFSFLFSLNVCLGDTGALGHLDHDDLVLFALCGESILDVSLQLLVVKNENDSAAEAHYGIKKCLSLWFVVRGEAINDGPASKHLGEDRAYQICDLLHLVVLLCP